MVAPDDDGITAMDGAVRVAVRAVPRARRSRVDGVHDGAWKVRIAAPPVDGAANDALIAFLAKEVLGVARGRVRVVGGTTSRSKVVEVDGADIDSVRDALWRAASD